MTHKKATVEQFLCSFVESERDGEKKEQLIPSGRSKKEQDGARCISCFNLKGTHRAVCGDALAPVGGGGSALTTPRQPICLFIVLVFCRGYSSLQSASTPARSFKWHL